MFLYTCGAICFLGGTMGRFLLFFVVKALALSTGACATVVEGTSQEISVSTTPPGASCDFLRNGALIGAVPSTPGIVTVSKEQASITVTCEKEGHLAASEVLSAEFGGTTLGNILLGGVIGVAIDAASGANNKYPDSVSLALPPETFESAEARDAFFDALRDDTERQGEQASEAASASALCRKDPEGTECVGLLEEIDTATQRKLAEIEGQRAAAVVE